MKTKLKCLFIGLTLLTGFNSVPAQPALGILPTNNQVVLFWPIIGGGTNGVLQSATNLFSPNWLPAADAFPVNYGSQTAVSVSNAASTRFFRLLLAPPTDGMTLIPAGSFTIGDTLDGEGDAIATNVYVSGFYMDTNLVSYSLWQLAYSYATNHGYGFDDAGSAQTNNQPMQPVETVNWYDVVKWSNARSQRTGLTPVYYTDPGLTQVYTNGDTDTVYPNWSANGYRLPTEAEWEKAARGGLSGQRFPWGNTISESQANYEVLNIADYDLGPYTGYNTNFDAGSSPFTSPVGYFAPNGYGLHDMAGNLYEWCWDWYAPPPYPTGSPYLGGTDPRGPSSSPFYGDRMMRGGNWDNYAYVARCAFRVTGIPPNTAYYYIGFRCAKGL